MTHEQIVAAVREVIGLAEGTSLLKAISGSDQGSFRQGIEDKVKDALKEEKVLTQPMFAGGQGDFEVSEQLKNRAYVGSLGALKKADLYSGPIPGEEEVEP